MCKWVSLYCHLNSISRQEFGEIIRGADTETTALGKEKKTKKPSNHSASCFDFFYSCVSTEVEVFSEL